MTPAPYETSLTALFTSIGEFSGFLQEIGPAIVALITNDIALHKPIKEQRIMDRRIRRCKGMCVKGNLLNTQIADQVEFDFPDLTPPQRTDLTSLLIGEINNSKILTK